MLAQLHTDFPEDVRVVYRHFPLSQHVEAALAAQAAEAAGLQGKFWQMHDLLFKEQANWAALTTDQLPDWLKTQAGTLGLDVTKFMTDLTSTAIVDKIKQARDEGTRIGIPGTPYLLINGKAYSGPQDYGSLTAIVKLIQLSKRQFTTCPPMTIDPQKQYLATLKTDKGDIVLQLYPDKAPLTVNSFVFLARKGWFDNNIFHRVLTGFVAQTGDPTGTGYGTPGYAFKDEISPDLHFDKAGVVGMANAGPGSNGSQFFITLAASPNLEGKYTIFGQVIQGLDAVQKLTPRDPSQTGELPAGDKLLSVSIEEK
ncbi:MAG: peptidylprolyl isomerase [Chloroflexi bacterium]|nr:peptidylprolyl isomerase [Chloroflexota bacterium]